MQAKEIFDVLAARFGSDNVFDWHDDRRTDKDPFCQVNPRAIRDIAEFLKSDPRFSMDTLECVTGVDYPHEDRIAVVYHLYSYALKHWLVAKALLPRGGPTLPSLVSVWPVANWQERECYDLMGVVFEGHPDLRRLLLPDDWEGHPLRKDYVEKADYHGIPTTRENPLELLQIGHAKAKE